MPKRSAQNFRRVNSVCGTSSGEIGTKPAELRARLMTRPLIARTATTPSAAASICGMLVAAMAGQEQRQYPRIGLGLPVTLQLLGRGQVSRRAAGHLARRLLLQVDRDRSRSTAASRSCCRPTAARPARRPGRVVRTVAYKGFAVLFDQDDGGAIEEFIRDLTPLPLESRAALLSSVLKPEIEIY